MPDRGEGGSSLQHGKGAFALRHAFCVHINMLPLSLSFKLMWIWSQIFASITNRLFPAIKKKLQSLTLYNHHFNYYNFRTRTSPIIGLKQKVQYAQRDKWQWVLSHMLAIITTIWSDAVLHFHIFSTGVLNGNLSEGPSEAWRIIPGFLCRSISNTLSSYEGMSSLKTSTSSCHRGSRELHPWAAGALQGEWDAPREGASC